MVDHKHPYIYLKRDVFYFSKRVPKDLKGYYNRNRIVLSLRTKSLKAAQAQTATLITKLEEDWMTLRWRSSNAPFSRFLLDSTATNSPTSSAPSLSEAKELYLRGKGEGRSITFLDRKSVV